MPYAEVTTHSKSSLFLFNFSVTMNCPFHLSFLAYRVSFQATTITSERPFALTATKPSKNPRPTRLQSLASQLVSIISWIHAAVAPHSRRYRPTTLLLRLSQSPCMFHDMQFTGHLPCSLPKDEPAVTPPPLPSPVTPLSKVPSLPALESASSVSHTLLLLAASSPSGAIGCTGSTLVAAGRCALAHLFCSSRNLSSCPSLQKNIASHFSPLTSQTVICCTPV